jgi:hypothetical protein
VRDRLEISLPSFTDDIQLLSVVASKLKLALNGVVVSKNFINNGLDSAVFVRRYMTDCIMNILSNQYGLR